MPSLARCVGPDVGTKVVTGDGAATFFIEAPDKSAIETRTRGKRLAQIANACAGATGVGGLI